MLIIPAIDIKDGKCVRLYKGDYEQVKVYADDPLKVAVEFQKTGVSLIHVVDLDGAKTGSLVNFRTIRNIAQTVDIPVEVGGGIRTLSDIKLLTESGINRIILGTSLIENTELLNELKDMLPYIIISMDLREKKVSTRGWLKQTDIYYKDFLDDIMDYGIKEAIITDISKDGTLQGPNIELYKEIAETFSELQIVVSGGISSLNDIRAIMALNKKNIKGIITGKAVYEKKIDLKEALELVRSSEKQVN